MALCGVLGRLGYRRLSGGTFIDGLPLTTNSDKDYHGFGMKSMKMIVGGYGGELSATASDGIFKLQIILARH